MVQFVFLQEDPCNINLRVVARLRTRIEIHEERVRLLQLVKKKCLITKLTTGSSNLSPGTCIHVISCAPGSPTKQNKSFRQDFDLRFSMDRRKPSNVGLFL